MKIVCESRFWRSIHAQKEIFTNENKEEVIGIKISAERSDGIWFYSGLVPNYTNQIIDDQQVFNRIIERIKILESFRNCNCKHDENKKLIRCSKHLIKEEDEKETIVNNEL